MPKKTGGRWRKCPNCKNKYLAHDERQVYCTRSCKQKAFVKRKRDAALLTDDEMAALVQDVLVDPDVVEMF
jgi:uncharacterized Zn ribbon protein